MKRITVAKTFSFLIILLFNFSTVTFYYPSFHNHSSTEDLECHEAQRHGPASIHNLEEEEHEECTFALWESDDSQKVSSFYESNNSITESNEHISYETDLFKEIISSLKHSRAPPFFLS